MSEMFSCDSCDPVMIIGVFFLMTAQFSGPQNKEKKV